MKLRIVFLLLFLPQLTLAQKPGVVSDTVPCKKYPEQTYALYLPSNHSAQKPSGLILFFDPGARGKLPVGLYQKIADKYSIILACSNNSQNGPMDISLRAGNAVLEDILAKYNVDKKFIIGSGFSGGARTAVDMSTTDRTITGLIACGAAFGKPDAIKMEKPIPFAEVVGQLDMNYQESIGASEYLKNIHNPALLTFFYGGHQWPPADAYEDAVAWHRLRSDPTNRVLEKEIASKKLQRAQIQIDSGYLFESSRMLKQSLGIKPIDSLYSIVAKDKRTRLQQKDAERADATEQQFQKNFYHAYTRHLAYAAPDSAFHADFWKAFRRDCDKMVASDRYKKLSGLRLIDYGWRLCAEQYYSFINDGQLRQGAMSARIWALMQPNDPTPCFEAARAFALQKRKPEAIDYLRQAVARGFKDQAGVKADPAYKDFFTSEDFRAVFR